MAHQMLKGKILSPVIEGPAGQPCMGKCSRGLCATKIVSTKILLCSDRLQTVLRGGRGGNYPQSHANKTTAQLPPDVRRPRGFLQLSGDCSPDFSPPRRRHCLCFHMHLRMIARSFPANDSGVPCIGGMDTGEPHTLRCHSAITKIKYEAWDGGGGAGWGGGPSKAAASVRQKLLQGHCLTPD